MRIEKTLLTVAIAAASILASCSQPHETTSNSGPDKTSLSGTPENRTAATMNSNGGTNVSTLNSNSGRDNFWSEAASGGMAEVELGRLAQTKAQNPDVKRFAEMMVADHTKSNDELRSLATKKNVPLPTSMGARHQATMDRLNGLSGAEFDRAYVEAMVCDHEATVQLFEGQTQGSSDTDARSFAEKTLPTLRRHLEMIKEIDGKLK